MEGTEFAGGCWWRRHRGHGASPVWIFVSFTFVGMLLAALSIDVGVDGDWGVDDDAIDHAKRS